jgi:hypothetical protein
MADGPATDPTRGTPSRRALGAMETAVHRARERAGDVTWTTPPRGTITSPLRFPSAPAAPPPPPDPAAPRERWLLVAVALVATLVVVAGIALAVSAGSGGPPVAAPPSSTAATTPHTSAPPARHGGRSGHAPGRSTSSNTTTSVPTPATPGGPPAISSISPSSGSAGQSIQVAGSNFLSSDGQIVATFNGQVASTSCPAQNTCSVTVPPMTGASSAEITITTSSGTSNAVAFRYS